MSCKSRIILLEPKPRSNSITFEFCAFFDKAWVRSRINLPSPEPAPKHS
jgi:hypothetical protein